jgi:hypothetical protein
MLPCTTGQRARWRGTYAARWFVVFEDAATPSLDDVAFACGDVDGLTGRPDTTVYLDLIAWDGIKNVGIEIDPEEDGGVAPTGNATIEIASGDQFLATLAAAGIYLEGRFVTIYHHDPASGDYTTAQRIWSGQVVRAEEEDDRLVVTAECGAAMFDRKLPPNEYHTEQTDIWTEHVISSELEGKAIPICLGEVPHAEGFTLADTYDDGADDCGRLVQFTDELFHVEHPPKTISDLEFGDEGLVQATGGLAAINTDMSPWVHHEDVLPDTSLGKIHFTTPDPENLWIKLLIRPKSWLMHNADSAVITNHRNAIDGDPATFATIPASAYGDVTSGAWKIPRIGISGDVDTDDGDSHQCWIFFVGKVVPSAGWDAGEEWGIYIAKTGAFHFYSMGAAGTTNCFITTDQGDPVDNENTPADWYDHPLRSHRPGMDSNWDENFSTLELLSECAMGAGTMSGHVGSSSGSIDLYSIALLVHANIQFPSSGFYAVVSGYKDDADGHFTGSSANVIENPCHLAAFLWARGTNAALTGVDIAGARAIATRSRNGWKSAIQITERDDASIHIGDLCRENLLWTWIDANRVVRMFPLSSALETETVTTITYSDLLRDGGIKSVARVTPDRAYSKITLKYAFNPISGKFDKSLYCFPDASSGSLGSTYEALCTASRDRWLAGKDRDLDVELKWVHDQTTAIALAKKIITRRTSRPWIVDLVCDIGLFFLEIGDPVSLDYDSFSGYVDRDALAARYRVAGWHANPENDTVELTLVEVCE